MKKFEFTTMVQTFLDVGTHKINAESKKPRKSRLLSTTKGEEHRIEL